MMQWIQWLNENWHVIVVPILVFLAFLIAGHWLRKIGYDLLGRWGLNKRQDLLLAVATTTHGPLLHWFILLGFSVAIQISILPSGIKILISKIVLSLLIFSLVWVAINLNRKIIQLYFPQIRLFLNEIRAPIPPIILLVNIARAVFIVIGLIILLRIWGAPNVAGVLVAAAVLIVSGLALKDVLTNVFQNIRISPRAEKRYNRAIKLSLNLLVIIGLGEIARRAYSLFSNQADTTSSIIILLLEFGILLWLISILRSPKYKRVNPSFKLTTSLVIIIFLIFTFAGVQPLSMYKDNLVDRWKSYRAAQEAEEAKKVAEAIAMTPMLITQAPTKTEPKIEPSVTKTLKVEEAEREAFELINAVREEAGVPPTKWSDELYELSKKHTQEMANKGELFHTPVGAEHGENAWGGMGYYHYRYEELAKVIVGSWMSSPLHKAWLLHAPIKESVVSIVVTPDGQYASWSFWTRNLGRGPALVEKVVREWRNSGTDKPWIDWLISEGYLD